MTVFSRALLKSAGPTNVDRALIECSPFPMIELEGERHILRQANALFCRLIGKSKDSIVGKPYAEVVSDGSSLDILDRVYRSRACELHGELEKIQAQPAEWSYIAWPVIDDAELPLGVVLQVTGPTVLQRARDVNEALMISVVQQHERTDVAEALNVQLEAEIADAANPDLFLERFAARLQSIAANQDLLIENRWEGIEIEALVRSQLAPLCDVVDLRIRLNGPALRLTANACQIIGMVVHELATNAVKYGALLNDIGHIEIGWRLHAGDSGPRFALSWIERDGPPVEQPQKQGFGSTVIGKMARLGLDAEISLVLSSAGLQWNLDCPEAKVLEPRALTPNEQSALPHDGMPRDRVRR